METTDRIKMLKKRHLDSKPCTSAERLRLCTEGYIKYAGLPTVLLRARVFAYVLENCTIRIEPGELLVGTHTDRDRCAPIYPEYSSSGWMSEQLDSWPTRKADPLQMTQEDHDEILKYLKWWDGKSLQDMTDAILPQEILDQEEAALYTVGSRDTATGHVTAHYERLLKEGLAGYKKRCQDKIDEVIGGSKEKQEKINFWQACIIACDGVINYAHRYADLAAKMALEETDSTRKSELEVIAENCRRVPENTPQSFYEAIQAIWFIQIMLHLETPSHANSLARFDQYMYPYYEADMEAGRITDEFVVELMQCLFIRVSDLIKLRNTYYSAAFAGYVMWPTLIIAGMDSEGHDASNRLSYLCLEASDGIRLQSPSLCLRICDETPDDLIAYGVKMNQEGQSNPAFFGDTVTVPMMVDKGATLEEARDWCIVGCIEPHPGCGTAEGSPTSGYLNALKCLELVLHNGWDPITGKKVGLECGELSEFTNIQQIMDAVKAQCINCYDNIMRGYNIVVGYHSTYLPTTFTSMVIDGAIESGKCIQEGGAKHSYTGLFYCGAASVADSLAAIDTLVFKEKKVTLEELVAACDANWEGYETLRQMCINCPKFGNDDDYVDSMAREILNYCADYIQQPEHKDARGGQYCLSNLSETLHVTHGYNTLASPDGRFRGTPLSDNASPSMGMDMSGPTAAMNSVANMDQKHAWSGTLFNIRFDPESVRGEKGNLIMKSMVKSFARNGGQHVQINVVDDATLRAAQENPEEYRSLVVRIAGYMAYFTELDKDCQDNLIYRTSHQI